MDRPGNPPFTPLPDQEYPPEARLPGLFLLSPKAICGGGGGGEVKEETAFGSGLWLFVAL